MKKSIILIASLFLLTLAAFAQPGERIKQLKIAFITERLNLSIAESQSFWPVYNAHERERDQLEKRIRQNYRKIKSAETPIAESELRQKMIEITDDRIKVANLDKDYLDSCLPILGAQKCGQLMAAEDDFKREIMKELRDRRPERP